MTVGRRRWGRRPGLVALLAALLLTTACTDDSPTPAEPPPEPTASPTPRINLNDVAVGSAALAERSGLYICGDQIVASAPAGGIKGDSFVVFDIATGIGEITQVDLPRGLQPNARWLLTTECVHPRRGEPYISVAYQEMPLSPTGSGGVRAAYTLDGEQLWMRSDLNQPAVVVDDVLVLGSAPEQPESAIDLRTGETIATFDPSVQARTVVSGNRMVVRGLTGPPVLMNLAGRRIARLHQASSFNADGGLLFGVIPAALPDTELLEDEPTPDEEAGGLTDASPSPSPTQTGPPAAGTRLPRGEVRAYSLRTGRPQWRLGIAPDPLGLPTVEPRTRVVVIVDVDGLAHGIDPKTGLQVWRAPTELESPRVTAAGGIVMFDRVDDPFQKLLDSRTGLPLPEHEETIVDLRTPGALQIIDDAPRLVSLSRLRTPPTTEEPTD
jgi:PQQ-like domain